MNNKDKIEVCRSFSAKVNTGKFENRDFFMSCKATCNFEDAEAISKELYHFCRKVVERDIEAFIEENKPESEKVIEYPIADAVDNMRKQNVGDPEALQYNVDVVMQSKGKADKENEGSMQMMHKAKIENKYNSKREITN